MILIDEPAWQIDTLMQARHNKDILQPEQMANFLQVLASAAAKSSHSVLIYTLPSKKEEIGSQETEILISQMKSAIRSRLKRFSSPAVALAKDDIYGVVRKRLFLEVGDPSTVLNAYKQLYSETEKDVFPEETRLASYRRLMEETYPFHPVVLNVIRQRWASMPSFQGTRDILRLLASIVTTLYQQGHKEALINIKDVPLAEPSIKGFFTSMLSHRMAVSLDTDIIGDDSRAALIDQRLDYVEHPHLAQEIATAIFMWSGGLQRQEGANLSELLLSACSPSLSVEGDASAAIDSLVSFREESCYYIHKIHLSENVKARYTFLEKRNLPSVLNEAIQNMSPEKVSEALLVQLNDIKGNTRVNVITNMSEPDVDRLPTKESDIFKRPNIVLVVPGFDFLVDMSIKNGEKKALEFAARFINSSTYRNAIIVVLSDYTSYSIAFETCRRYLAIKQVKENWYERLTETDQKELEDYGKKTKENMIPTLLACLSHIFIAHEGNDSVIHLSLGTDAYTQVDNLVDRIWDFLIKEEIIITAIAPSILADSDEPYWNVTPEKKPVPLMSLKEIWVISYRDGRAGRFANEKILWSAIKKGMGIGLFILGQNDNDQEIEDLKFKKVWETDLPSEVKTLMEKETRGIIGKKLPLENYYLIKSQEDYKIPCPNCAEWNNPDVIVNRRCPSCQKRPCTRCGKLAEPSEIDTAGCNFCRGKVQCPTCQRFVLETDLRLDGTKCKTCLRQVRCNRCGNFVNEDDIYEEDCVVCHGKEKCLGTCNNWYQSEELEDGYCKDCRITYSECKICGKTVATNLLTNGVCPDCLVIPPSKAKEILIQGNIDYKNPWIFFEYVTSPLTEKNYLVKLKLSVEMELGQEEEEWDEGLLSTIKESISQINQSLDQHPDKEKLKLGINYKEIEKD